MEVHAFTPITELLTPEQINLDSSDFFEKFGNFKAGELARKIVAHCQSVGSWNPIPKSEFVELFGCETNVYHGLDRWLLIEEDQVVITGVFVLKCAHKYEVGLD